MNWCVLEMTSGTSVCFGNWGEKWNTGKMVAVISPRAYDNVLGYG